MAKYSKELTALIKKFDLAQTDVWDCHGTMVMLHRACEKVAVNLGIIFDSPAVLAENGESVAILVTGRLEKESAWSIGEASPKNNKNSYPWAMAEKRAKDRVILKLARFNECGVYSDIEADDFKKPNARASDNNELSPAMQETIEEMDIALDWEQVSTTLLNYFDGDKDSATDFLGDAGFPIPSKCTSDELYGILDALKVKTKAREKLERDKLKE